MLWTTQKHSHHKTLHQYQNLQNHCPSTSHQQTGLLQFLSWMEHPANQLVKLQRVQNMACRVILCLRKYDCITSHLKDLHWLKVHERIRYKIATLMFNIKCKTAPMYLQELVKEKPYRRALRSTTSLSSVGQFNQPFGRTSQVFNSSFIISGPRIWNALPVEL